MRTPPAPPAPVEVEAAEVLDAPALPAGEEGAGAEAADPQRENNDLTNGMLEKIGNDETVVFLNINDAFLTEDGVLTKEVMPDLLHPEAAGYKIWAEAMEPTLAKLLGE